MTSPDTVAAPICTDSEAVDLDALEALLAEATPVGRGWSPRELAKTLEAGIRARPEMRKWHDSTGYKEDGALVAAAVNALPALIAELRTLRTLRAQPSATLGGVTEYERKAYRAGYRDGYRDGAGVEESDWWDQEACADGWQHYRRPIPAERHPRRNQGAGDWGVSEMVAALYVATDGCYFGLPGVDPWDEARDARKYDGPWPVVSHTPCQRWGNFYAGSPLAIKQGKRKLLGDDGGCFAASLQAVRTFGGIVEHPQGSRAWRHFGLNEPPRAGGWVAADWYGGWTCRVEQGFYGHFARKPTWLLAYHTDCPPLHWGFGERRLDPAIVERWGLKRAIRLGEIGCVGGGGDDAERIATPLPFRDLLLSIARTARPLSAAA